jgi:hypothetical protein
MRVAVILFGMFCTACPWRAESVCTPETMRCSDDGTRAEICDARGQWAEVMHCPSVSPDPDNPWVCVPLPDNPEGATCGPDS